MSIKWADEASEDYRLWHTHDQRIHTRVNKLIDAVEKDPFHRISKPKPLRHK